MAERAPTLSSRGWLQLGSLQIDLGTRTPGRSSVSPTKFVRSLLTLAVILVGLAGLVPRRPATLTPNPLPPAAPADESRPTLGPTIVAAPSAPIVLSEPTEGEEAVATIAEALTRLIALPTVRLERGAADVSALHEVARAIEVDPAILATVNGIPLDSHEEMVGKPDLVVPLGLLETTSLKLRPDPIPAEVVSYVINAGDTLYDIALRFGVTLDTLALANGLSDPDLIRPGDQLSVAMWSQPAHATALVAGPAAGTGSVDPSVTLSPRPDLAASAVVEAAAEAPAVARPPVPTTYEVTEGDTVSVIAERFGVDTETIVATNGLSNADRIRVGDELTILPVSGVMHVVREGQTLSEIAELYKVDLGPIIDFNYLEDVHLITVGRELLIPGGRPLPPPAPRIQTEYQVQPGDTLIGIAVRFGVTSGTIAAANTLLNPDRLGVGTRLVIPGVTAPAQPTQQVVTRNLPVFTPAPSASVPLPTTGGGGDSLASFAMRFLGSRYIFGGTTPAGFDCSGFVYYVQANAGKSISRGMWGQYNAGPHPSRNQLQPGDIVFFQNTYMAGLSHNGIYIGNGNFIHASDERSGVKISNINEGYWASRWFGATRVW